MQNKNIVLCDLISKLIEDEVKFTNSKKHKIKSVAEHFVANNFSFLLECVFYHLIYFLTHKFIKVNKANKKLLSKTIDGLIFMQFSFSLFYKLYKDEDIECDKNYFGLLLKISEKFYNLSKDQIALHYNDTDTELIIKDSFMFLIKKNKKNIKHFHNMYIELYNDLCTLSELIRNESNNFNFNNYFKDYEELYCEKYFVVDDLTYDDIIYYNENNLFFNYHSTLFPEVFLNALSEDIFTEFNEILIVTKSFLYIKTDAYKEIKDDIIKELFFYLYGENRFLYVQNLIDNNSEEKEKIIIDTYNVKIIKSDTFLRQLNDLFEQHFEKNFILFLRNIKRILPKFLHEQLIINSKNYEFKEEITDIILEIFLNFVKRKYSEFK